MATINSIPTLSLWLDATDPAAVQRSGLTSSILKWVDKSSNAYEFIPMRDQDRPVLSTNSVCFDQVSSFQFMSRTKIPATSSLDFFAMVTPYSLFGPFQPLFDSADITISETDTRFNTQIYADGGEYFKNVPMPSTSQGAAIYRGDLYIGQNTGGTIRNFLQKWNPITENFDFTGPEYNVPTTQSLTVYQGKLYASCDTRMIIYDGPTDTLQGLSSIFVYGIRGPYVYNRSLYTMPRQGFYNRYNTGTAGEANPVSNAYLYKFNNSTQLFETLFSLQFNRTASMAVSDFFLYFSNAIVYKGAFYMFAQTGGTYPQSMIRYQENSPPNVNLLAQGATNGYGSIFYGNLIVPRNDQRLFKYNPPTLFQNFGRLNFAQPNACVTYKGNLWIMKNTAQSGFSSNTFEIFTGEGGGPFSNSFTSNVTTNTVTTLTSNTLIVHDGRLFLNQNSAFYNYVYGNGTSLDQSFSTLVGAPILLNIRRDGTSCEMYLNGTRVQTKATNFTFSNQAARQMFIGGAAGSMSCGASDCGSDHYQGAIHSMVEYSSILSLSDRQRVEGILCWQFGTQETLPLDHPYRNSPP